MRGTPARLRFARDGRLHLGRTPQARAQRRRSGVPRIPGPVRGAASCRSPRTPSAGTWGRKAPVPRSLSVRRSKARA